MKYYGNLAALKPLQRYILLRQLHKARRAGLHTDVRIGAPLLGLFSWAAPKDLPTVLNLKRLLITQPLHTYEYKDFLGTLKTKYGLGTVKKLLLSPIIILLNTGDKIKFKRDTQLDTPVYTMIRTKNGNWITTMNKTAAISQLMLLQANSYYLPSKWQHVLDVLQKALELKGKELTDVLQASILWHDSAKKDKGSLNHARNGAQIAKRLLKSYFSPEDIKRVAVAIKQHNLDLRIKDPATFEQKIKHFASPLALLLAIADDARPSDPLITWKKTLAYNIKGLPTDKTSALLYNHMKLRLDPRNRMPQLKYYKDAFNKDNASFIKWLDNLTLKDVEDRVQAYKKEITNV